MSTPNGPPRILAVGEEPPPLELPEEETRRQATKANTPKGKLKGERFRTINAFVDFTLAALDRAEIAVWLILWRDTKKDGQAQTSQADLARRAGTNQRTVRRALKSLRQAGLLTVVYQGGLNRGLSVYRVQPLAQGQEQRAWVSG
jgi:hypothetical protein